MPQTLVIRHIDKSSPPQFQVFRADMTSTDPAPVTPPKGFPVEGRPDSDLPRELRWYLEEFLGFPFSPETEHADRVLASLRKWGEQTFAALFGSGKGRDWYTQATAGGSEGLHLKISSDDPFVLAWPWEALRDPATDCLGLHGHVERKLNHAADPPPLSDKLPKDRVNILLVTARPYEGDVRYRSISRPLVELIDGQKLPATITVLRPPTLDALRRHLATHPGHYHIVHFDGHGGYGIAGGAATPGGTPASPDPYRLQGLQGVLVFETDDGKPDDVSAQTLSVLLREHGIPAVVLNACQSGMADERAADEFASVAAAMVKAGVRTVVAMAYSLYVSGAQQFLPAFYRQLFATGSAGQAARAGRREMFAHPGRVCARGTYPLQDWLVPVVYQKDPIDLSFASKAAKPAESAQRAALPLEAADTENPYGLVGRDGAILEIERAMRRPPAGILVQGLGGVGKTTLARGFVNWLAQTDGLGRGCFWFAFNDIRSAEYVANRMGEALFGPNFIPHDLGQKIEALAAAMKEHPFLVVWDNFESARGIEGTSVTPLLPPEDQQHLKRFLKLLRGGRTKVLITSRSDEDWLEPTNRFKVPLGGLQQEERWEFCRIILHDLGLTIDRNDANLVELMDLLAGHPLMMRAILPKLADRPAQSISTALKTNILALADGLDETQKKVFATLRFVEESLPQELRSLLLPLALHEGFVDADCLEVMANQIDPTLNREKIDRFLSALGVAGLVRDRGQDIYELHPALTGFLRSDRSGSADPALREWWGRAFVDVIGRIADALALKPLHEQRAPFHIYGASFHVALTEASRYALRAHLCALTQCLALYAQNTRDYASATRLFEQLAVQHRSIGNETGEVVAYHQMGRIAQERRELDAAERWYRKSVEISERLGVEQYAASTYHQLGRVAEERRDFDAAERWYRKSLEVKERLGNEHGAATTYHQLGMVAQERRDLDAAERWYRKSLEVEERLGNEHGAATTYHQLGIVAEERRDFDAAERWYRKSLEVKERLGDEHGAATTYHQLGLLALERGQVEDAGGWTLKALTSFRRTEDLHLAHQAAGVFDHLYANAPAAAHITLAAMWEAAGLGPFEPPSAGQAPAGGGQP